MDIVQNYEKGQVSKVVAVRSILTAFTESTAFENSDHPQEQQDATIGTYIAMLDQHDNT